MYGEDPLVYHGKLKAKWAAACVDAISVIREEMGTIGLPILIIHGSEDSLMPITASQFIYDRVSSSDKIFEVSMKRMYIAFHCMQDSIFILAI